MNQARPPTDDDYDLEPDEAGSTAGTAAGGPPMGFLDHLEELRWTLVKCATAFVIAAVLIAFFLKDFNDVVMWPLRYVQAENPKIVMELGTTSIMEGFGVIIQLCGFGALALSAPLMLVFIGQFVAPALSEKEMRLVLPAGLSAGFLFFLGAAFGFFLLVPSTIRVATEINELLGYTLRWTPASYFSMLVWLVLGVGAAFEFPLLIVIAIHFGLLRVETLRKFRRHAVVAIFLIAAVVTPTPDPFTQSMFAAPLYVLYEIAIIVGARVQARREARMGE
ncbi:MAG: twin-arginine translocase subunit TatC [Verrucomicrobia bacterium]|nr:MAG: twin-arginine translocase subunit TatC [Verrucomicrobiota bacterium]